MEHLPTCPLLPEPCKPEDLKVFNPPAREPVLCGGLEHDKMLVLVSMGLMGRGPVSVLWDGAEASGCGFLNTAPWQWGWGGEGSQCETSPLEHGACHTLPWTRGRRTLSVSNGLH